MMLNRAKSNRNATKPSLKEPLKAAPPKRAEIGDVEFKCTEMADDIYRYLVHHEKKFVLDATFLSDGEPTDRMRRILVDWMVRVQTRFNLLPETLHLSVFVLDQMLSRKLIGKNQLQLLGISSMYVASKFEEKFLPDVYDYEYITENAFSKDQILKMEQFILSNLQFDLSCPSSLVFTRWISRIISEDEDSEIDMNEFFIAYNMSKYFGELALLDSNMTSVPRSHISMASMYISLRICRVDGVDLGDFERTIITCLDCSKSDVQSAVRLLSHFLIRILKQEKLDAVKQKYMSPKLGQVSNLVDEEAIDKLEKLTI